MSRDRDVGYSGGIMSKTITMYAKVAFDYRGTTIQPGQPFHPHSAAEAVVLKNRKKADFRRPAGPIPTSAPVPHPVPVAPRGLETSTLESDDDRQVDDSSNEPQTTGRGRGRYRRQDMRATN